MTENQAKKAAEKMSARRIRRGDRIVVLPPEGHGDVWVGAGVAQASR